MTTVTCDKCGKKIFRCPEAQMKLPSYLIYKNASLIPTPVPIDLCSDCQDKLDEWLKPINRVSKGE